MQAMMLQSGMVCAADLEAELPMLRDALAEDALEQARGDDALALAEDALTTSLFHSGSFSRYCFRQSALYTPAAPGVSTPHLWVQSTLEAQSVD